MDYKSPGFIVLLWLPKNNQKLRLFFTIFYRAITGGDGRVFSEGTKKGEYGAEIK